LMMMMMMIQHTIDGPKFVDPSIAAVSP